MAEWRVVYEDAIQAWEEQARPGNDELVAVLNWLLRLVDGGPPDDHLPVPLAEDLYVSRVPETGIFITYLALAFERRVVIRGID